MKKTKEQLEKEFQLPVFSSWVHVPIDFLTEAELKGHGIEKPFNVKPCAIKNSEACDTYFFLYKLSDFGLARCADGQLIALLHNS